MVARALSQCPIDDPEHKQADDDQLEEVKNEGKTKKGLAFLTQEDRSWYLTMPDVLKAEIGIKHPVNPDKRSVIQFFDRYAQQASDNCDHYFDTQIVPRGSAFQSTLVTPSLYNWTFAGWGANKFAAETSACCAFWNDPRVKEIASKLAPTSKRVKQAVTAPLKGPFKKKLLERGIDLATLTKEARDEMFLQFKDTGCRLLLWDGNA